MKRQKTNYDDKVIISVPKDVFKGLFDCGDCDVSHHIYQTCSICETVYLRCNSCNNAEFYQNKIFKSKTCNECHKYICKKCIIDADCFYVKHDYWCNDASYGDKMVCKECLDKHSNKYTKCDKCNFVVGSICRFLKCNNTMEHRIENHKCVDSE